MSTNPPVIDGLGNDVRRTRCHYCHRLTSWVSNFPSYGRYTCQPCYMVAVRSAHLREELRLEFRYRSQMQGRSWFWNYAAWRCRRAAFGLLRIARLAWEQGST